MLPKLILHNSISLDGSLINFEVNMNIHYKIAGQYKPNAHLIGSNTLKTGFEIYGDTPRENKNDLNKPDRNENLPYWIIIDSRGILHGLLHACRRFELCRDVIIIISETTPKEYIKYLEERNYNYHCIGKKHIDIEKTLKLLGKKYNIKTILTDTGRILGNLLLKKNLIDEISLLIHPTIVGQKVYHMFSDMNENIQLKLLKKQVIEKDYIWLVYKVKKLKKS